MIVTLAFLAGAGWAVALLALFLALRFRADWSAIWKTAWVLRREGGWTVPDGVEDALTEGITQRPRRRRRNFIPTRPPVGEIVLTDAILQQIAQTSEMWHQEELANLARQMLAGNQTEAEVINEIQRLLEEEQT